MNGRCIRQASLVALAILLPAACSHSTAPPPSDIQIDQISFISAWTSSGSVRFTNGEYREPAAPDSAADLVVQTTGDIAAGELNGVPSAALVLVTNAGGSGTFFDLALLQWQSGAWINTDVAELGDRVQVHAVSIENDTIRVKMTTHGPGDPMCCPSLRTERQFGGQDARLVESSVTNRPAISPAIAGKVWKWQRSRYSNDTESLPPDPDHYTLQLLSDGNINVRADCNRVGGVYRLKDQQITIEITHSTMAACPPGSLEQTFIKDLNAAAIFFIRDEILYFDMKYDSGTMEFQK